MGRTWRMRWESESCVPRNHVTSRPMHGCYRFLGTLSHMPRGGVIGLTNGGSEPGVTYALLQLRPDTSPDCLLVEESSDGASPPLSSPDTCADRCHHGSRVRWRWRCDTPAGPWDPGDYNLDQRGGTGRRW